MNYFINAFTIDKRGLVLYVFLAFFSLFIVYYPFGTHYDFSLVTIFFISILISLFGFLSNFDDLRISLNKIFFIFHFLFFGLSPVIQFKFGTSFFGAEKLSVEVFKELGFLLIFLQVFYIFFYFLFVNSLKKKIHTKEKFKENRFGFGLYLVVSVLSVFVYLYLIKFNGEVLLFKPKYQWLKHNTNLGLLGYSLLLVFRSIPFVVLIFYRLNFKKEISIKDFILLLCLLIVAFPTSIPRGDAAGYYLPLLIIYLPILERKYVFSLFFILSFLVVFPILNYTRNYEVSDVDLGINLFNSAHFDAFQNMGNIYGQKIITNGRQFLGSMFFFIQESNWPNRPVGTGQMLAEVNNYSYTNISMPLWGEGYVNFGFIGVFTFVLLIAIVNSYLDFKSKQVNSIFFKCLFLFFIGFEFYLLRGDLFSSFKKLDAFILAFLLVYLILNKTNFPNFLKK